MGGCGENMERGKEQARNVGIRQSQFSVRSGRVEES